MKIKTSLVAGALLTAGLAQATCYTVFKTDGTILLETSSTPVDLTQPLGDTIPAKFGPGATMTMSAHNFYCGARPGEVGTANSLAEAVRAEEKKTMLIKGPEVKAESVKAVVAKAEPAKAQVAKEEAPAAMVMKEDGAKAAVGKEDGSKTVMVKQDGTNTVVETQKGTVLKVKGKAKAE
ncbi:MAG: hypothetical protein K0R89_3125 [Ramlibacter sp.]|jgi:hypothetical protein|nr:hypothetical protein [Ramlibacter sp.]